MIVLILKHIFWGEYGAFDRIVEFLVFVLILYEVIAGIAHRRSERKREKFLETIVNSLTSFLGKGNDIRCSVPDPQKDWAKFEAWRKSEEAWSLETEKYLLKFSKRAYHVFALVAEAHQADSFINRPDGYSFPLAGSERECYQALLVKLSNLGKIIENPESYF